jgi:SPP1 gp7 family putative phage head morphogenesis protein
MNDALAFVQNVYEGKYKEKGSYDRKRVNKYAKVFSDAVDKGWKDAGGKLNIDYDTPDAKMLASLKDNVFHFSAAKNRAEIIELSALLRDDKGKLRSWESFKKEALNVTTDFQERYMKVEYDMAVNSAYLAARWQEYDDDDILVFTTAGDTRVRDSHKQLDGVSLPKSHSFWRTFYPPLAWNCRCTVVVTHSGRVTPEDQIPYGEIDTVPPIFRSNFAIDGYAFPPEHPYIVKADKSLLETKGSIMPYEIDRTPNGFKVLESQASHKYSKSSIERARQKIEYTQNRIAARLIGDHYKSDVLLLPELNEPEKDVRYVWEYLNRGYKHKPKMVDSYLIDAKKFYEVKSYEGNYSYEKLSKMMKKVQGQTDIGVLFINQDITMDVVKNNLDTYLNTLKKNKKNLELTDVFAIINGQLHKIH